METKTKFGFGSIAKHPPKWVVPVLALIIGSISIASLMVTGDPGISDDFKIRINHYLNGLSMLVTLVAAMFGVDIDKKR